MCVRVALEVEADVACFNNPGPLKDPKKGTPLWGYRGYIGIMQKNGNYYLGFRVYRAKGSKKKEPL